MEVTEKTEGLWNHLSTELWGCIFSHVRFDMDSGDWLRVGSTEEVSQAALFNLRTVCRKFNAVFEQHPLLYCDMFLGKYITACHSPSLIRWLQSHGRCVQNLATACGSPSLDVVLATLFLQGSCLQRASLENASETSLPLLAMCTTVTRCHLNLPVKGLDLQVLSVLPNLASLTILEGQVSNLNALAHLTHLGMYHCFATCNADCRSCGSLLSLKVYDSTIERFHEQGITACNCLMSLWCRYGDIQAVHPSQRLTFNDDSVHMPESWSALTALTELNVESDLESQSHFESLSQLKSLQALSISTSANLTVLPECLSTLSGLTNMELAVLPVGTTEGLSRGRIMIEFDWSAFVSLHTLKFYGLIAFSTDLCVIADLSRLRQLCVRFLACDLIATKQLMRLAYKLGQRPEVSLSIS